jgi:chromosome segregation ATPase
MPAERTTESYQEEIKELQFEIKKLQSILDEERCDKASVERECECYKQEIQKNEIKMEFMRGQIEAFKFCVASGKGKKNAE